MGRLVACGVIRAKTPKKIDFFGTHGASDFYRLVGGEIDHFAFVVSPIERETQQRVAQLVFIERIEVHVVGFVSEVFAGENNRSRTIVVGNRRFLPFGSPGRSDGIWNYAEIGDGLKPETARRDIPTSKEIQ